MIDTYKFSTLKYKRPDLEARRAKLAEWKTRLYTRRATPRCAR